jgi:hypothetical protein
LFVDGTEHGIDILWFGEISLKNETAAGVLPGIFRVGLGVGTRAVLRADNSARIRERFGEGRAHVLGHSGNQRYLAVESHCQTSLLQNEFQ